MVEVFAEEALARARQLDEERADGILTGKLHGVVFTLKDVICYRNHPVSAASRMLQGYRSDFSATAVEKILQEGAIIIGTTNCDEFAMGSSNENSVYGPVKNGLDERRVPGGSSGGSAVAVQKHLCMVSLGSDTGGSVRQPADFCGITGLKPTYGRVSRWGLIAYASSFDQIGILAHSPADAALVLEVIAGNDGKDSTASAAPVSAYSQYLDVPQKSLPVLGYIEETLTHPGLEKEMGRNITAWLEQKKAEGYLVKPLRFDLMDYIVPTYYILTTAEASSNLSRYDGVRYGYQHRPEANDLIAFYQQNRSHGFGKEVQRRIMLGTFVLSAGYYDAYFTKAQQVRRMLTQRAGSMFAEVDAIIMPVSPTTAFMVGEKLNDPVAMYLADIYTVFANLTGLPAIAIPTFRHSNGMPYGLQILTKHFDEVSLLRLAHQFTLQKS